MDLGLTDRACIVTGGSRGIGRQVAAVLVAEGARVLLVGRGEEALRAAAEQCEGDARTVSWLALDVTAPDAGERAVAACRERFETVDVLVNGAGMSQVRSHRGAHRRGVAGDVGDPRHGADAAHARRDPRDGRARLGPDRQRVLVLGQAAGAAQRRLLGDQGGRAVAVARLRRRLRAAGVLINAVTPGPVASELWLEPGGLVDQTVAARGGHARARCSTRRPRGLPIRRLAGPEEIAAVIVFLCSEQASNVAGAAWSVDGGAVPVII